MRKCEFPSWIRHPMCSQFRNKIITTPYSASCKVFILASDWLIGVAPCCYIPCWQNDVDWCTSSLYSWAGNLTLTLVSCGNITILMNLLLWFCFWLRKHPTCILLKLSLLKLLFFNWSHYLLLFKFCSWHWLPFTSPMIFSGSSILKGHEHLIWIIMNTICHRFVFQYVVAFSNLLFSCY